MIKTIDINAKEWFDRINGNSYFSAIITTDYGTKTEKSYTLFLQYGYGEHYIQMARDKLNKLGIIKADKHTAFSIWCRDNNIILRTSKQEGCLKRELDK